LVSGTGFAHYKRRVGNERSNRHLGNGPGSPAVRINNVVYESCNVGYPCVFHMPRRQQTLLSIDFDQQIIPVKTIAGSWEKDPSGIKVNADSRIIIPLPARAQVKNGSVRLGFLPPEHVKARTPMEPGAEDCSCALKLCAGRCFAEVSDKGLSLKRLAPTFDYVDATLGFVSRNARSSCRRDGAVTFGIGHDRDSRS